VFLFHHLFTSTGRAKYGALLTATGAPWRAGLAEQRPWFLTDAAEDLGYGVRHEADYWLDVASLAGARRPPSPRLEIAIDDLAKRRAARLVGDRPTGRTIRVALSPSSGKYSPGRRWSASSYVAVGRRLVEDYRHGIDLLVVGTADEKDLADTICAGIGPVARNIAGQTDLKTLAAILATCDALIGNDGGAMHVAVAAGIPVLAIFGPSDHVSWGPYGAKAWDPGQELGSGSLVVRHDLPCAPCLYRGYLPGTPRGCHSHDCLRLVTPTDVVQAAHHILPLLRKG
jgi:heptosyltransferase-2